MMPIVYKQAVFCFQLQRASTKAVHVVFGGGATEFDAVKVRCFTIVLSYFYRQQRALRNAISQACIDLRVPVICIGGHSLRNQDGDLIRDDIMASLLVSGQRDLMVCDFCKCAFICYTCTLILHCFFTACWLQYNTFNVAICKLYHRSLVAFFYLTRCAGDRAIYGGKIVLRQICPHAPKRVVQL
jgi:hypothetical protein